MLYSRIVRSPKRKLQNAESEGINEKQGWQSSENEKNMENFDTWWNRMYSKIPVNQKEMCRAAFEAGKAQSDEDVPERIALGFCKLGQAGLHMTTEPHQQTDDCIDWTPQE
jgi:hypothetical protein